MGRRLGEGGLGRLLADVMAVTLHLVLDQELEMLSILATLDVEVVCSTVRMLNFSKRRKQR